MLSSEHSLCKIMLFPNDRFYSYFLLLYFNFNSAFGLNCSATLVLTVSCSKNVLYIFIWFTVSMVICTFYDTDYLLKETHLQT